MPDITLKRFDPRRVTHDKVIAFIGKRGSGKTTAVRDFLYFHKSIPNFVVFSATEECNDDWGGHVPGTFIHSDGYDGDQASLLMLRQRRNGRANRKDERIPYEPVGVLCEDCMFDNGAFCKDKSARDMLMNGRQARVLLLITIQYMMDVTRSLRSQFDFVYLFFTNDRGNIERAWKTWGGGLTFAEFDAVYKQCTRNRGCLVIDTTAISDRVEDYIFWYIPKQRSRTFKIGSQAMWNFHFANCKTEEELEQEYESKIMERVQAIESRNFTGKKGIRVRKTIK